MYILSYSSYETRKIWAADQYLFYFIFIIFICVYNLNITIGKIIVLFLRGYWKLIIHMGYYTCKHKIYYGNPTTTLK